MTQSRFFQLSLLFPFVLWCLGLLIFSLVNKQGAASVLKNLYDGYHVFVPYLIFAGVVWKMTSHKPYRMLIFMAFVVPITWGVFFTLFYVLVSLAKERTTDESHVLCIMAFWATVVGYLVEIIPFLILAVFKDNFKSDS
jgi:heme/copper-type cytochrome/quinol oxidase subunit 2